MVLKPFHFLFRYFFCSLLPPVLFYTYGWPACFLKSHQFRSFRVLTNRVFPPRLNKKDISLLLFVYRITYIQILESIPLKKKKQQMWRKFQRPLLSIISSGLTSNTLSFRPAFEANHCEFINIIDAIYARYARWWSYSNCAHPIEQLRKQ